MRDCTVSAPVQSCNLHLLSSTDNKFAAVELLTKENLYFIIEGKSRAKDLYAQTCAHLSSQGMLDGELFGLAVVCDGEYLFVDPDNKLSKYAPKHWKASNSYGLDSSNRPTLLLYFRVQYYVDSSLLLRDDLTRHHYYLQLRDNVLARGLVHSYSSRDVLYQLAGLALQADYGDYDCNQHSGPYFVPHEYFPREMVDTDVVLEQTLTSVHRDNRGLAKTQAELQYITKASSLEASRLTNNSHLYRLKHKKQEPGNGTVYLAICARGIEIYEENSAKALTATFLWNNIGKLCFDRKKFEIRALNWVTSGDKYTYYTNSDEKSKHLLFLCRVTHQFSMTIQPRLTEVKRRDEEEKQRFRDCYLSLGPGFPSSLAKYKYHHSNQRISVISNTSSNTTSGIVSDRVHSLDESEDDLEPEIMIISPPAPPEESLSAHPVDLEDKVVTKPVQVSSSGKTINKQLANVSCGTPALTEGSQCSSSGSTVVVALPVSAPDDARKATTVAAAAGKRRASTSSSLELGFSHTAQNSAVSDSPSAYAEVAYSVESAHTSSGIYTLRSSNTVESQDTNAKSSETSGVVVDSLMETYSDSLNHGAYSVANTSLYSEENDASSEGCVEYSLPNTLALDSNEPMRDRSGSSTGSLVSASGSFRGDGSDPSDSGPRNLLSAEELSDLIVGNGSSEIASGIYPTRATVSSNLDSDSDYVTLPPPPMPPPRMDSDSNYVMLEPSVSLSVPKPNFCSQKHSICSQHLQTFPQNRLHQQQFTAGHSRVMPPVYQSSSLANLPLVVEEANARFITTKPHINIITAHTSLAKATAPKRFAAPTIAYPPIPAGPNPNRNGSSPYPAAAAAGNGLMGMYPPGDTRTHPPTHLKAVSVNGSPRSAPYVGYLTPDPGAKMKPGLLTPIIGTNNYLDMHASRNCAYLRSCSYVGQYAPPVPPPTLSHSRQPPPPPPNQNMATVYTSQVCRGQIEQFHQQMYSDVDYVIYPLKDPLISKQEYMDAKQGSLLARSEHYPQAIPPPPYPYIASDNLMYRSTPNVASLVGNFVPFTNSNKYASIHNLAGNPNYLSGYRYSSASPSPRYSGGASYSSSSNERSTHRSSPQIMKTSSAGSFHRAKSSSDLLNSYHQPISAVQMEPAKYKRLPPPPPPPPYESQIRDNSPSAKGQSKILDIPRRGDDPDDMIDIRTLREKSKNLDLPLISALCNDRSLLKQTNAFVMPQHPPGKSAGVESGSKKLDSPTVSNFDGVLSETGKTIKSGTTLFSSLLNNKNSVYGSSGKKVKYPVSGLSATQMCKPSRKVSASTHTHPHQRKSTTQIVGRSSSSGCAIKDSDPLVP